MADDFENKIGTFDPRSWIGFQKFVHLAAAQDWRLGNMLLAFHGHFLTPESLAPAYIHLPRSCSAPNPWVGSISFIVDRRSRSSATIRVLPIFIGAFRVSRRLGIPCKCLPLLSLPHNLRPVSQAIVTRLPRVFLTAPDLATIGCCGTHLQEPMYSWPALSTTDPIRLAPFPTLGRLSGSHVLLLAPAGGQIPE